MLIIVLISDYNLPFKKTMVFPLLTKKIEKHKSVDFLSKDKALAWCKEGKVYLGSTSSTPHKSSDGQSIPNYNTPAKPTILSILCNCIFLSSKSIILSLSTIF